MAARAAEKEVSHAGPKGWRVKTPWTLLLKGDPRHAADLERLLSIYREPVYAYYRADGLSESDADDLTQHLLMDFFLVKESHRGAQPARGRFRFYLLAAARHALLDWRKRGRTIRRGGNRKHFSLEGLKEEHANWEPSGGRTPAEEYERHWALATWCAALDLFRSRHDGRLVEAIDLFYGPAKITQQEAARRLGVSVAAFNSRLHSARRRLFACIQEIVQTTVENPDELRVELDRLRALLESGI